MQLREGDILCTHGTSFISRAIRWFSRTGGESRTMCNHVAIVVNDGTEQDAMIVEALSKVKYHSVKRYTDDQKTFVAVYRPTNVSEEDLFTIANKAYSYVGASYGYIKIVAHFLDWCLGGRYFFRRFARMEKYPICSWVVADAYAAVGLDFGVPVGQAQPDDIWDYCVTHPERYEVIHPLSPLGGWEA